MLTDLKVLLMCGLPGGYPDDLIDVDLDALEGPAGADGVIRVSNADYLARPLRLTPTEATAIIVALRALRDGAGDETREVVDRALGKLEAAAAEGCRGRPDRRPATTRADTDVALLATRLRGAADRAARCGSATTCPPATSSPSAWSTRAAWSRPTGTPYLDAWCHSAEAPRLFRLDRIDRAEVLDEPVETPQRRPARPGGRHLHPVLRGHAGDPAARARGPLDHRVLPGRGDPRRWARTDRGRPAGGDERWLTRLMLRLAPHATVVPPATYADAFTAAAQRALSLYSEPRRRMTTTHDDHVRMAMTDP